MPRKWLIDHQIFKQGDWSVKRPDLEPGGWAFEFYNDWYPDVDDSAVILMVLARTRQSTMRPRGARDSRRRQLGDGHAIEATAASPPSTPTTIRTGSITLPLADVEAVTDPIVPRSDRPRARDDGVGRLSHRSSGGARAIEWLKRNQDRRRLDGGGAGASTISTAPSRRCRACARSASTSNEPWIKRAVAWLKSKQNADGGWGESLLSATRIRRGAGAAPAPPSQTAWALIGLLAGEDGISDNVDARRRSGCSERQNDDGRVGRDRIHRHRLSRIIFTCATTCMRITFR